MPTHAEKRHLPYTPQQMFDLVADCERYPEFLPWCVGARIRKRIGNVYFADLIIGFKLVRERYTSKVTLNAPNRVDVTYTDGPFSRLNNHWVFEQAEDGGTNIDFYLDFEFRSRLLQTLIGPIFNEAVRLMVHAFEKRAGQIYGADGRLAARTT
jgi:coenzyme Q-binding protein COQ10